MGTGNRERARVSGGSTMPSFVGPISLLVLVAGWLDASPAAAQSFYLQGGPLTSAGEYVGAAVGAPVTVTAGPTPVDLHVRFSGAAATFEADADLRSTHLQAGVGGDVALGDVTFATTMLAGTWAPVRSVDARGTRIVLPAGAPFLEATIPPGAPASAGAPAHAPWASGPVGIDDPDLHCLDLVVTARRGGGASWRVPAVATRHRVARARGWDTLHVELEGFRFVGYRRTASQCDEGFGGLGLSGTGAGSGDGSSDGRLVTLPAGIELYASATATTSFATLRVETMGIEPLRGVRGQVCDAAGRCTPSPPLPSGVARWIVQVTDPSGAVLLLEGWVRTPAERLHDAPPGHFGGFGLPVAGGWDWP